MDTSTLEITQHSVWKLFNIKAEEEKPPPPPPPKEPREPPSPKPKIHEGFPDKDIIPPPPPPPPKEDE